MKSENNKLSVAIIIPVFNRKAVTLQCIAQLQRITAGRAEEFKVVIVDDGSSDGTAEAIKESYPKTIVLPGDGNLWWTGAINLGVEWAINEGLDATLTLNDDLELDDDFLEELLQVVYDKPNSLVSSIKLLKNENNEDVVFTSVFRLAGWFEKIENTFVGSKLTDLTLSNSEESALLTGASLYIPTRVYKDIGMLDFDEFPHNWGDFEFTRRAAINGYSCYVATKSKIYIDGDNPNYIESYFFSASRRDYIKNLFDRHKYNYGFDRVRAMAFMHRPWIKAWPLYVIKLGGLARLLAYKLILPKKMINKVFDK